MLAARVSYVFVPILEQTAAALAAGAVLGTFIGATRGFLTARSRMQVESNTLREGYFGAVFGACLLLFEPMERLRCMNMNEPEPPRRNVLITLAVGLAVAQVGIVLFRHDPEAKGVFLFFCLVFMLVLHVVLDELWLRKQRRGKRS